jgi:hypothetical protein
MATVLEEYTTKEQRSVMRVLWAEGLSEKDIHKEIFPVYGGKCLSRKALHNWVANVSLMWLRQLSKDFRAAGFAALLMRRDKCVSVVGGYVEK